jgi:hypothetical protein
LLLAHGRHFKLEEVSNRTVSGSNKQVLVPSQMTTTLFKTATRFLAQFPPPSAVSQIANDVTKLLHCHLHLTSFSLARVVRFLTVFYWSKRLYHWLLQRVQPTHLLLITAYGAHALVAAAKELSIPVIEFQHGFLDQNHPGYSWSAAAHPYKNQMPLPDYLFLYGDYWRDQLQTTQFWDRECIVTGSLRMDTYRQIPRTLNQTPTLILTTQYMATEAIIQYLTEFLQQTTQPINLIIKLHPAETHNLAYQTAFQHDNRVKVLTNQEQPSTFALLRQAHYHLSISSTCHYEALALGVPTIILPFRSHESVMHLCQTQCAFLADTPQKLHNLIFQHPYQSVPQEIGDHFFTSEALSNMLFTLNETKNR